MRIPTGGGHGERALPRALIVVAAGLWLMPAPSPAADPSVARQWNEALLSAIRIDFPAPTVHARNLYHTSAAMWDAWASFDDQARGVFYTDKALPSANVAAARDAALSYAAYRVLSERYTHAVDPGASQAIFDGLMGALGHDRDITTTIGNTPAAIGNRIAEAVLTLNVNDGSNERHHYVDYTGYAAANDPLVLPLSGDGTASPMNDPNRWQPLAFDLALTQNGLEADLVQTYVGPHWGAVTPFALRPEPGQAPWTAMDPGPPPQLGGAGDATFRQNVISVIQHSAVLDPGATTVPSQLVSLGMNAGDSTLIDISPASLGNRPPGTHIDQGHELNPATHEPYTPQWVRLGDYGRVIAEFWADGPESETPPGHWFTLANAVADHPLLQKRIGGVGPRVDDLEWDVKTYLALGGAVHDAAVAAWGAKRHYDYVRPISMIRYMGGLGQSSEPGGASYHPDGLPLVPGLVELIINETTAEGERHEHLAGHEGEVAIFAWAGEGAVPAGAVAGCAWIRAVEWWPYQRSTFVTPAFAAYLSGHSTFSRAAAEVLAAVTGDPFFPGGLGEYAFPPEAYLAFEPGPSTDVTLQWATYFDAADEAGISRLFGGIHVASDDFPGRIAGSAIGTAAWQHGLSFFGAVPEPAALATLATLGTAAMLRRRRPRLNPQAGPSRPAADTPAGAMPRWAPRPRGGRAP